MTAALDPEMAGVSREIREALIYSRIDELPEPAVDLLAWQLHVDFYEPVTMDIQTKRNLVKSSIIVHRKKGTPWAVRRIMADLGFQVEYSEWWQFGGAPFVDRLKVWIGDGFDFSAESRNLIMLAWNLTKAARTHLESLSLGLWFLDDMPAVSDGLDVRSVFPFYDAYPWRGLRYGHFSYGTAMRYGHFHYGDGTRYGSGPPGTHRYGEDSPDILSGLDGKAGPLEEEYGVPSVYGQARYGHFFYGCLRGVQDGGGEITVRKPLIYGRFRYGEGMPRYGRFRYGDGTRYGGCVRYGGKVTREAI
jgi:phage tail P2-like protein